MSKKKKTVKQQDFQKKKLKIGKGKVQPSNITNTSFVSKQIKLPNQNKLTSNTRATNLPTLDSVKKLIANKLLLLTHYSPNVRKDSLQVISKNIKILNESCNTNNNALVNGILNKSFKLMCDDDKDVRNAYAELLIEICETYDNGRLLLELNLDKLVLYLFNAMTHITFGIKTNSGMFLKILCKYCPGDILVRRYFIKVLNTFLPVLGWSIDNSDGGSSNNTNTSSNIVVINKNVKSKIINLEALTWFIKMGIEEKDGKEMGKEGDDNFNYNKIVFKKYLLPEYPQPYKHLKLYERDVNMVAGSVADSKTNTLQDLLNLSMEDYNTRLDIFNRYYKPLIEPHLNQLIKEGGELGKMTNNCLKLVSGDGRI
ncbi:related to Pre-rRNA-processing protein IPI1 [Saccharomycodes ludwigii]|uniref:Pre-rRNA-processing protein n=1 Tax=Saccharomycodes ludwigii TaxID=36035 RepID=A0A376BCH1_9ASCO|nr:hypothetical protein SCDLUD_004869 [Saccharomycodes ludwigii]KAH3899426.1 hypothetical protein SCDLUD_004869 [Saccharomycodes ludwigii]SSD61830.1 related to Pre-rRNA-processing protein IPI1 [Saccharomycodes ludwigii]